MRVLKRIAKWLGIGIAGLVVLLVLVAVGGWAWLHGSLPETDGTVTLASPEAPAEIRRDAMGIVTIRAESWTDAYFALGYAHAQDRLAQMETMRRIATGRLSEVAGSVVLDFDRLMRAMDFEAEAKETWETLDPDLQAAIEAYAGGINGYLDSHEGPWPPEFLLAGTPERWQPWHSLLWGKLMALRLSGNWRDELDNARFLEAVGPQGLADLFPELGRETPTIDGAEIGGLSSLLEVLPRTASLGASNIWAVAGSRTESGKPVLASDPHLGLQAPATWYLARLETPEGVLAGATSPGIPLMVIGHNGHAAWGFTTTHSDTQDFVVETVDPDDPGRYLTPSGPQAFETREETFRVRFGQDVTETFRSTRFGPVLSDASEDAASATEAGKVLALAWPFLQQPDTSPEALWRLNFARSWDDFTQAMSLWTGPQQNVFWANVEGTIGFYAPALVPVRDGFDGSVPVAGAERQRIWTGTIPFEALPHAVNPPDGVLINANNRIAGPDYPYSLGTRFEADYRYRRIAEVLDARETHRPAYSRQLQLDEHSVMARELVPALTEGLAEDDTPPGRAVALLKSWAFDMTPLKAQPLLLYAWLRTANETIFADELGDLFDEYDSWNPNGIAHALTSATHWCDDTATEGAEDCGWARRESLQRAIAWLEEAGAEADRPDALQWGDWHVARLQHMLLGRIPLLGDAWAETLPIGGGNYTVKRATPSWGSGSPFRVVHGAGLRAVFDLSNLDNSDFAITSGQSGNPLSDHFLDFAPIWADGGYVKLVADERAEGGRLVLRPQ